MATAGLFAQSCSLDDAAKIPLVELGAPTKEFIVESLAGDVAIPVYSNGAFHVENVAEGQEWIALDKWEGNGDDTLYVEYTFNEEFDPDPFMDALNAQGLPWQETFTPVAVP